MPFWHNCSFLSLMILDVIMLLGFDRFGAIPAFESVCILIFIERRHGGWLFWNAFLAYEILGEIALLI